MRHRDMFDEVAAEMGVTRKSVLGPILGIPTVQTRACPPIAVVDDAECVREQPRASASSTQTTTIERGRVDIDKIWDIESGALLGVSSLVPCEYGVAGRFEITVTFTPEPEEPCRACSLHRTCRTHCADWEAWAKERA